MKEKGNNHIVANLVVMEFIPYKESLKTLEYLEVRQTIDIIFNDTDDTWRVEGFLPQNEIEKFISFHKDSFMKSAITVGVYNRKDIEYLNSMVVDISNAIINNQSDGCRD